MSLSAMSYGESRPLSEILQDYKQRCGELRDQLKYCKRSCVGANRITIKRELAEADSIVNQIQAVLSKRNHTKRKRRK